MASMASRTRSRTLASRKVGVGRRICFFVVRLQIFMAFCFTFSVVRVLRFVLLCFVLFCSVFAVPLRFFFSGLGRFVASFPLYGFCFLFCSV